MDEEGQILERQEPRPQQPAQRSDVCAEELSGRYSRLLHFVPEFQLFTPGALHVYTALQLDPVVDFLREASQSWTVARLDLPEPVFSGLALAGDEPGWNRRLLAIEKAGWPELLKFFLGLGLADSKKGMFWRVQPSLVFVPDVLALKQVTAGEIPTAVPVTFLGLRGNRWSIQAVSGTQERPALASPGPGDVTLLKPAARYFAQRKKGA